MSTKFIYWTVVLIAAGIYVVMVAWSLPTISADAGGLMPFDMRPEGYTYENAKEFLTKLSNEGKAFYRDVQHKLDLLFPFFEALAVGWGIYNLAPKKLRIWRVVLALTAVPGMIFDYLENGKVALMLKAGAENVSPELVELASFYTQMKSAFVAFSFVVLIIMIGMWFLRRKSQKQLE